MSSAEGLLSNSFALDLALAQDADTSQLLLKAVKEKPLTDVEQLRLSRWAYSGLRHWKNVHYLYYTSALDEKFWPPFRHEIMQLVRLHPYMAMHWRENKSSFTENLTLGWRTFSRQRQIQCEAI